MRRTALACLVLCAACRKEEPPPRDHAPGPAPAMSAPSAQADLHAKTDVCAHAEVEGPIAWVRDDYAGALACAKQRHVPMVIDLWAPWCHTCLSMQTTVFRDPSFAADGKRFVFVSLDTDKDANAAALEKLAIAAWPTFYVLGDDEAVRARFVGGASAAQFHAFLDSGAAGAAGDAASPDAHLAAAERALAAKDLGGGERELTAALAAAPASWARRPDALVSLAMTMAKRKENAACVQLADKNLETTGNTAAASDFLVSAMDCADAALEADPATKAAVGALRKRAIARWRDLLADRTSPMSVDDRSDAMASLRETIDKDEGGANKDSLAVAAQQRDLLDKAAAAAPTPFAAMTYNWPRAEVYVYLKQPMDLVPSLQANAAALPDQYDPPARLGWVLMKAGKFADAAIWTDKALALAYGPRKARLLGQRADIAHGLGDAAGERTYRQQAVDLLAALPAGQHNDDMIASAKQKLTALDAPATGSGSAAGSAAATH